ncbi:MAG TPA: glycosyltransferase [Steroidobacteraceae bacterium]|jgi:undecaprenyl-phosphate 4-deoxy-4-formamido-L-arabinose transferase|nr:glycosyltransferase [Steroidobacteraceae bacterium]
MTPLLSVIVPVYNEEQGLPALFERLYAALDALGRPYEVLFVDDGSRDRSVALLRAQFERRPEHTRVIVFASNAGQHMAILAGFEYARGLYVVTLDADLQNPPEEIGKLVAAMENGADYVGTIRRLRRDSWWRRSASRLLNRLRERTTRIRITDQGCMLRGYHRTIVDAVNQCHEVNTFVPALAYTFARHPTEIEVAHAAREHGVSKYSFYRLIRLNFDLMTGFSLAPLQFFTVTGMLIACASLVFVGYLALRRIFSGPEAEGVFTLFGIAFFLIGVLLLGLGVVGEYVGRIYEQVRQRPRFVVAAVLERDSTSARPVPESTRPFARQVSGQ